jgi:hypothetical protein
MFLHLRVWLYVYRFIERVTLNSYVCKDMYMLDRYVELEPLPGYPAWFIIAWTMMEEVRRKQCGRECPGQGEEAITRHLSWTV